MFKKLIKHNNTKNCKHLVEYTECRSWSLSASWLPTQTHTTHANTLKETTKSLHYWPFVLGIHQQPMHSPRKGPKMFKVFSLIIMLQPCWLWDTARRAWETRGLPWWQLCRHWQHWRLLLWQPLVPWVIKNLSAWHLLISVQILCIMGIGKSNLILKCQNWLTLFTQWGQVMQICLSKLTIIGSDNGLLPGRCQAIICTNAGILLIGPLGTKFNEILIKIYTFSFKKIHFKMSSGK